MPRPPVAAEEIATGDVVLTVLDRTQEPQDPPTTTGMPELREPGAEGPTTCTTEEGAPAGATARASITGWWTEREGQRRCYDKELREGR